MPDAENIATLRESCIEKLHSFLAEAKRMEDLLVSVHGQVSNRVWRRLMEQRRRETDALGAYYEARNRLLLAARPQSRVGNR